MQGRRRETVWAGDTIPGPSTLANYLRTFGAQCAPAGCGGRGGERKESEMRRKLHVSRSRLRNLSLTYVVNVRGLGEACFV